MQASGELIPMVMTTMLPQDVNIPPEAIHAAIMLGRYFFAGCVILGIVPPLIRLVGRRFERPTVIEALPSTDTTARLERIEQAVDAVAIEVERIAEAQRFSAKLMAEQRPALLVPRSNSGQ